MTDDKTRRQVQEALDANLEPDAYRELLGRASQDRATASEMEKLQSVDGMLREARPAPRPVPRDFAKGVLARLPKQDALPIAQPLKSGRALAIGMGVGAAVSFVALVGLSAGLLAVFGSGTALSGFALGIVGAAVALSALMNNILSTARELVAANPLIFAALLLIPLAWFGLHRLRPAQHEGDQ